MLSAPRPSTPSSAWVMATVAISETTSMTRRFGSGHSLQRIGCWHLGVSDLAAASNLTLFIYWTYMTYTYIYIHKLYFQDLHTSPLRRELQQEGASQVQTPKLCKLILSYSFCPGIRRGLRQTADENTLADEDFATVGFNVSHQSPRNAEPIIGPKECRIRTTSNGCFLLVTRA